MGQIEDRLKGKVTAANKSPLQEAMDQADAQDAADILRQQAIRRTAEERLRTKNVLDELHKGEDHMTETNAQDIAHTAAEAAEAGVTTEEAIDLATGKKRVVVIKSKERTAGDRKGSWAVVNGQVIKDPDGEMTLSEALQVAAAQNPGAKLGWTVVSGKPIKTLDGEMTLSEAVQVATLEKKETGDPEVKELLKRLTQKDMDTRDAQLKAIADQNKAIIERLDNRGGTGGEKPALSKIGLYHPDHTIEEVELRPGEYRMIPVGAPVNTGMSVEETREKNRHDEEMAKITEDKHHKGSLRKIAADAVDSVTKLGAQLALGDTGGAVAKDGITMFKCKNPECGKTFPIPADAPVQIECPHCHKGYTDTSRLPPKPKINKGESASTDGTPSKSQEAAA